MRKRKMHTKKVFSKRIALRLVELGANLIDVQPNRERMGYMMYVFEVDMRLDEAFKKMYSKNSWW